MNYKTLLLFFVPFLFLGFGNPEPPAILNFPEFEKQYLHRNSDTLYIVNFWATWCSPCVKELPCFEKVNEKYKSQKVKVLLVSLDFEKDYKSVLIPFLKKKAIHSEVVVLNDHNENEWIDKVNPSWSGAIPATLVYNKDSRDFYEKSFRCEELDSIVKLKTQ
ncbi:MAG: TlpA disulfide reductase family protein [Bacteroidales bacterium]